jgi:hypothetical protein
MRFRLGTAEDLPAALELLRLTPCFRASDALWMRVMPAWRDWLSSDQMSLVLWEDPRMAPSERLRAAGMSVFVSDAFAESTIRSGEPYPARRLYENPDGPGSAVLSQDAIGWANARDGVNLFVLHNPMREHDLQHPSQRELLPLGPQAFYFCHAGYYVKTLLWECYGQQHIDYLVGSGFSLLSSYAPVHPELAEAGPRYRPFLGGLRRPPEVDSTYDPIRLCLFNRCEPLLGLTPPQQKLLRFAHNVPHGIVYIALSRTELATYWNGTGKIGSITGIFSPKIHQEYISSATNLVVAGIMQDATVGACCYNRIVGMSSSAVAQKLVRYFCLNLVFHYPWTNKFQYSAESFFSNTNGLLNEFDFYRLLVHHQLLEDGLRAVVLVSRVAFHQITSHAHVAGLYFRDEPIVFFGIDVNPLGQ